MSSTICLARGSTGDHLLHSAPTLLELRLGQVGHALGLDLEPLVHLGRGGEVLVDVAGLVAQIQHHAVSDRLVELVGMDERAERLDAGRLVGLQQRGAGEADEHRLRQDLLHGVVHLAGLGAVGFVNEDEDVALGPEVFGDPGIQLGDEVLASFVELLLVIAAPELVHQRADRATPAIDSTCPVGLRRSMFGRSAR